MKDSKAIRDSLIKFCGGKQSITFLKVYQFDKLNSLGLTEKEKSNLTLLPFEYEDNRTHVKAETK